MCFKMRDLFSSVAESESGMEEDTRSVSGFLHFETVSKGLYHAAFKHTQTVTCESINQLTDYFGFFLTISAQEAAQCAGCH